VKPFVVVERNVVVFTISYEKEISPYGGNTKGEYNVISPHPW